ncbi:NADH-quinone oxidoreductase subunit C [Basilea psittacipulmonis]|uniref:NADH-quinone oxidoreductase subunit C n=1 Tax=Basilea psittacipulmonis DSM 24701 TaxID=1072685 RepID=A0A077DI65_9BURK|nr:NADH-quinone oxidoreductase subunit C [Basilea psittacipulmonis]AIL33202.1 NADH dehydrogenase [Basilea psittacipulmonis DSM 24701]
MTRLEQLKENLLAVFGQEYEITEHVGELTLHVPVEKWIEVCTQLRDDERLKFISAMDLCGVDYSTWGQPGNGPKQPFPGRYAVVVNLLSVPKNWRLRVQTWAKSDDFPSVPSLVTVWNPLNWFEREAFDMYGIVFEGHPDLRRILTDYGFIGHPLRKDFPVSGYVEMRYDEAQGRVVYQPVTIEPREITPRVIREEGYGANHVRD